MDYDGSGEVSVEELEGPLLSTGIAKTLDDVKRIVDAADSDRSGAIGFPEFLEVLRDRDQAANEEEKPGRTKDADGSFKAKMLPSMSSSSSSSSSSVYSSSSSLTSSSWLSKHKARRKMNPIIQLQRMKEETPFALETLICQKRRALLIDQVMIKGVAQIKEHSATKAAYDKAYFDRSGDASLTAELRRKKESQETELNKKAELMEIMRRVVVDSYNNNSIRGGGSGSAGGGGGERAVL